MRLNGRADTWTHARTDSTTACQVSGFSHRRTGYRTRHHRVHAEVIRAPDPCAHPARHVNKFSMVSRYTGYSSAGGTCPWCGFTLLSHPMCPAGQQGGTGRRRSLLLLTPQAPCCWNFQRWQLLRPGASTLSIRRLPLASHSPSPSTHSPPLLPSPPVQKPDLASLAKRFGFRRRLRYRHPCQL